MVYKKNNRRKIIIIYPFWRETRLQFQKIENLKAGKITAIGNFKTNLPIVF